MVIEKGLSYNLSLPAARINIVFICANLSTARKCAGRRPAFCLANTQKAAAAGQNCSFSCTLAGSASTARKSAPTNFAPAKASPWTRTTPAHKMRWRAITNSQLQIGGVCCDSQLIARALWLRNTCQLSLPLGQTDITACRETAVQIGLLAFIFHLPLINHIDRNRPSL